MGLVALVTGGNKGIGYAIVKELAKSQGIETVILTARDVTRGQEAVKKLQNEEGLKNIVFEQLDVSNLESIDDFGKKILEKYHKIDILVNNAGIYPERVSFLDTNLELVKKTFDTNTLGPLKLCQNFVPKMKEQNFGRIVNVSSGAGQLSDMNGTSVAYRFSKVSLNALTRIINDEMKNFNILCNTMCPGYVKTDMTGGENSKAPRTPEQAAVSAVWLATLPADGPRGKFFRDKNELPW